MKKIITLFIIFANTMICLWQNIITKSNHWIFCIIPASFGIIGFLYVAGVFDRHNGLDYQGKKVLLKSVLKREE